MKLIRKALSYSLFVMIEILSASCVSQQLLSQKVVDVHMVVSNKSVAEPFPNLDKSLELIIASNVSNQEIYDDSGFSNLTSNVRKILPNYEPYIFSPSVRTFAEEATQRYLQCMQFNVESCGDYLLSIDIKEFKLIQLDKSNMECKIKLLYKLNDATGQSVIPTRTVSSQERIGNNEDIGVVMGQVYANALDKINWSDIARYLKISDNPKEVENAMVTGAGDTSLEHTIIRWFIASSPQGADVTWRVVSSTPDVSP